MVAGGDIDVQVRHLFITEFLKLFRQSNMPLFLAVFRQVAGDEKHIGFILLDRIQQRS